jgi:pyridoxal phosphate enzyme (YggS family)
MSRLDFKANYDKVLSKIEEAAHLSGRNAKDVQLIAVSKFQPVQSILEAYHAGCRVFGESRVQEALDKIPHLPDDCKWHFIGSLQTNKVAKVLPFASLIHSVDKLSLAQKISSLSQEKTSILLQVNISGEGTKHGLSVEAWEPCLEEINQLPHLNICGLMTMAPLTTDEGVIRLCFRKLYELQQKWKTQMREPALFKELSMGMSNDYQIAIQEGSTMVRIGSALFRGEKDKQG